VRRPKRRASRRSVRSKVFPQHEFSQDEFSEESAVLSDFPAYATLPASDLTRARRFYEDKLGFKPGDVDSAGVMYRAQNANVYLYTSTFAGTNKATAAGFNVTDLAAAVAELKAKGITFEEYDMGGEYKTVNGIMKTPDGIAAWFKDTEGNIIGLFQG